MSHILSGLHDLIFPRYCLGCGRAGNWLCESCAAGDFAELKMICPKCKKKMAESCCRDLPLERLYSLSHYRNYPTEKIIKQFKYGFSQDIARDIIRPWLSIFYHRFGLDWPDDTVIVPLPLHRKKQLERGFNQAELLARELGLISGWQVEPELIRRIRYNKQQAKLSKEDRIKNTKGIFTINYRRVSDDWNKPLILIDDVYTTGSTMGEAARVLKEAGFDKISGLAVAVD